MQKDFLLKNFYRPTWVEIDLSALEHNFFQIKNTVGRNVKTLLVLKADAYGHGAVPLAKRLIKCKADFFGLASIEEAIIFRNNNIHTPILLMGVLLKSFFPAILKYNIIPTICDATVAYELNQYLKRVGKVIPVHLKIDTGMNRIGVWHNDFFEFVKSIKKNDRLLIEGVYTHLASADSDKNFTIKQLNIFRETIKVLESFNIKPKYIHAANSAAIIGYKNSYFNLVRPGLMIYGLYPDNNSNRILSLKPLMTFKTRVISIRQVLRGASIGYGRTYIAKKDMKIAVLPVGYADGYNRLLSNRGFVLIRGQYCPIVGRICMDYTMVDISKVEARLGDEVVLFGRQRGAEIRIEEIATLCSTISYEVTCWISPRVNRIYIN